MNKNLIDLQRNSKATCVIVKNSEYKKLTKIVSMQAGVNDKFLLLNKRPPFADKLDEICKKNSLCYFVIKDLDLVSIEMQNRFVGMVKDREFNGYNLPDNCIIVFTVQDEKSLQKVSQDIYRFAVVSF